MKEIEYIRMLNDTMIIYNNKIGKEIKENEYIEKVLNDDAFFFKTDKKIAYQLLKQLNIPNEQIEDEYNQLTSKEEFYQLVNGGCVTGEDFKIKYKLYNSNELFKEKKRNDMQLSVVEEKQSKISIIFHNIFEFFKSVKSKFKRND